MMPHTHNRNTTIRSCALLTILHTICCHPVVVPTSPRYDKPNKGETLWSEAGHLVHKENTHGTDKFEKKANLAKLETLKKKTRSGKAVPPSAARISSTPPPHSETHPSARNAIKLLVAALCVMKAGGALSPSLLSGHCSRKHLQTFFFFLHNVESVPLWH